MSSLKATSRVSDALSSMTLNQTMIRIKDPKKSIPFYQNVFSMSLIQELHFSDFSLYFMATLPNGHQAPTPCTKEASKYLQSGEYGCVLELTHNHGTETNDSFKYHNGNTEPLGFGHISFLVDDLNETKEKLAIHGSTIQHSASDEASSQDPDGYIINIRKRIPNDASIISRPSFHHTMIRVKDITASLLFYQTICGMSLIHHKENEKEKYTSYFLGTLPTYLKDSLPNPKSKEAEKYSLGFPGTMLELRYCHGSEKEESLNYHNGNTEPRGFGHLAIMVENVYEASEALEEAGAVFQKRPNEGRMKGLAFVKDPDNYWIEIIQRCADIPDSKESS